PSNQTAARASQSPASARESRVGASTAWPVSDRVIGMPNGPLRGPRGRVLPASRVRAARPAARRRFPGPGGAGTTERWPDRRIACPAAARPVHVPVKGPPPHRARPMFSFLKCVADAIVSKGFRSLARELPFGSYLLDVASEAWRRMTDKKRKAEVRSEVE